MKELTEAQVAKRERRLAASRPVTGPTGGQVAGPQWRGPKPARPHFVHECAGCLQALVSRAERVRSGQEEPDMGVGVTPGSPLAAMLEKLAGHRAERRMLLSVIQAADTPRRARLEKRLRARLSALGVA